MINLRDKLTAASQQKLTAKIIEQPTCRYCHEPLTNRTFDRVHGSHQWCALMAVSRRTQERGANWHASQAALTRLRGAA